jgi:hypothetical protein
MSVRKVRNVGAVREPPLRWAFSGPSGGKGLHDKVK